MDFKDWYNKELSNDKRSAVYIAGAKRGFEAGQQSKQAEIDELQKRINEALELINNQNDTSTIKFVSYAINKILRGELK